MSATNPTTTADSDRETGTSSSEEAAGGSGAAPSFKNDRMRSGYYWAAQAQAFMEKHTAGLSDQFHVEESTGLDSLANPIRQTPVLTGLSCQVVGDPSRDSVAGDVLTPLVGVQDKRQLGVFLADGSQERKTVCSGQPVRGDDTVRRPVTDTSHPCVSTDSCLDGKPPVGALE